MFLAPRMPCTDALLMRRRKNVGKSALNVKEKSAHDRGTLSRGEPARGHVDQLWSSSAKVDTQHQLLKAIRMQLVSGWSDEPDQMYRKAGKQGEWHSARARWPQLLGTNCEHFFSQIASFVQVQDEKMGRRRP
jgi:hypothetical protein